MKSREHEDFGSWANNYPKLSDLQLIYFAKFELYDRLSNRYQ